MLCILLISLTLFPKQNICTSVRCDSTPELNKKIVDFVNANMNKKVGRGECWDLAAQALNTNHAKWDRKLNYGTRVDSTLR